MLSCVIILAILLVVLIPGYRSIRRSEIQVAALEDDCVSGELFEWYIESSRYPTNNDPCFQAILRRKIFTYERFLRLHPFISDNGYLEHLRARLV